MWIPLTPDEARGVLTSLLIVYVPAANSPCSTASIYESNSTFISINEEIDTQSEAVIDDLLASEEYCVSIQVGTIAGESDFSQGLLLSCKCV